MPRKLQRNCFEIVENFWPKHFFYPLHDFKIEVAGDSHCIQKNKVMKWMRKLIFLPSATSLFIFKALYRINSLLCKCWVAFFPLRKHDNLLFHVFGTSSVLFPLVNWNERSCFRHISFTTFPFFLIFLTFPTTYLRFFQAQQSHEQCFKNFANNHDVPPEQITDWHLEISRFGSIVYTQDESWCTVIAQYLPLGHAQ